MTIIDHLPGPRVHNPDADLHFMWLTPVGVARTVKWRDFQLAHSSRTLRVTEVGRAVFDPVSYFPVEDVTANLQPSGKVTDCPIKGRAEAYDLVDESGEVMARDIAWRYVDFVTGAEALRDRFGFDAAQVTSIDHPRQ